MLPLTAVQYEAAANGYRATLTITASSRTAGRYVLAATARDFLSLGAVGSSSLTLLEPDTLLFQGSPSLPGATLFQLASSLLTLVSTTRRSVALPGGTIQATTRIVCQTQATGRRSIPPTQRTGKAAAIDPRSVWRLTFRG